MPSVAYCIYERRSQLKVKYRSMPNDVIAAAAKRGEAVSDVTYIAKIAYTGDTIIDGVLMHPDLLSVTVLFRRCLNSGVSLAPRCVGTSVSSFDN